MKLYSVIFLLFFLPGSLAVYWLAARNPRIKLWVLLTASLIFYGLAGLKFLPVLVALSILTFVLAQRRLFTIGIIINLLALALFKYWGFGIDNLNAVLAIFSQAVPDPLLGLALPLGISYYVFKHIGYLVDVKKGRTTATTDLPLFLTYSAFFPQIVAGPLSSFSDTGKQLASLPMRIAADDVYKGLFYLTFGLVKKILIADRLLLILGNSLATHVADGLLPAWLYYVTFSVQLYFDFSGYTDIVLGIALLFGMTLPPNFNNPYLAENPVQLWQRWHISLSQWFRFYVFSPFTRYVLRHWDSRLKPLGEYTANLVTMILIGIWHGATWGYLMWGAYHGVFLALFAWSQRRQIHLNIPILPKLLTYLMFTAGLVLLRVHTLDAIWLDFRVLFGMNGFGSIPSSLADETTLFAVLMITALVMILLGKVEAANVFFVPRKLAVAVPITLALGMLAFLSLMFLGSASDFAYAAF